MSIQITLITLSIALLIAIGVLIWLVWVAINNQNNRTATNKDAIQGKTYPPKKRETNFNINVKYANSNLREEDKEQYLILILDYLEQEKIYRQSNLTIGKLAKQIKIPKHHLSQVINEKRGCSFLDFINQYRIKEAKEQLTNSNLEELTLVEIGRKVGFKAKSTFYTAFKKYTRQTPGEFRKEVLIKH